MTVVRVVIAMALFFCSAANALVQPLPGHYEFGWTGASGTNAVGWDASAQVACTSQFPFEQARYGGRLSGSGYTAVLVSGVAGAVPPAAEGWQCWGTLDGSYRSMYNPVRRAVGASCPANSTAVTGGCQCAAGFVEEAGACVPQKSELEEFCKDHKKFTFKQTGTIGSTSPSPQNTCYMPSPPFEGGDANKGCTTELIDFVRVPRDEDPLLHDWSGTGKPTGATCEDAAATDEAPKAEDDKCPGGFAGTVNGVEKCIPAEPDKGIESVERTSETDSSGTVHDTTETTKCNGDQCTVTTTTTSTSSSGSVTTTTSSSTGSIGDLCKKDPANKACEKTNGGQGSGASSPSGCSSNSSGKGCGGAAAGTGDLYTGKEETIQQVMDKAVADLKASGIGSSVGNFFTVQGGGACPSMVWNVPYFTVTVALPGLCSELAAQLFMVLRSALLLVAGFFAFRAAIDN